MKKDAVVGIDIGGSFTKLGIVDRMGNILVEKSIVTCQDDVDEYIRALSGSVNQAISEAGVSITGIGIGAPDASYMNGTIEYATNLRWGQDKVIPFVDLLKGYFDLPVVITNDANAAAVGEMLYGGAKGMTDFIMITLGTGLGSGIVSNGRLVYGHDGFAGEIGQVIVCENGRECGCGRRGCLEAYVSAPGITRTVSELLSIYHIESRLRDIPFNSLTSEMIHQAAVRNDFIALEAFERTGRMLGVQLANAAAYTSPQKIFLFGGLARSGDYILKPVRESFEKNLLKVYQGKIEIGLSALPESSVAVLGAAALVWEETGNREVR